MYYIPCAAHPAPQYTPPKETVSSPPPCTCTQPKKDPVVEITPRDKEKDPPPHEVIKKPPPTVEKPQPQEYVPPPKTVTKKPPMTVEKPAQEHVPPPQEYVPPPTTTVDKPDPPPKKPRKPLTPHDLKLIEGCLDNIFEKLKGFKDYKKQCLSTSEDVTV